MKALPARFFFRSVFVLLSLLALAGEESRNSAKSFRLACAFTSLALLVCSFIADKVFGLREKLLTTLNRRFRFIACCR
jgi:hypothetical protein